MSFEGDARTAGNRSDDGMGLLGAAFWGAAAGIGSNYTNDALVKKAPALAEKFSNSEVVPRFTTPIANHLAEYGSESKIASEKAGSVGQMARKAAGAVAEKTTTFGPAADKWLAGLMKSAADSNWAAPEWKKAGIDAFAESGPKKAMLSLRPSALRGSVLGLADYGLNSVLSHVTGMNVLFKPNAPEAIGITLAAMSPLAGKYKVPLTGAVWTLGRGYDLLFNR